MLSFCSTILPMKQKLLNFLILFAISFSALHAYTVDMLDTKHNHVIEYVQEVQHLESDENICHMHHFFHISYIIPDTIHCISKQTPLLEPFYNEKNYTFKHRNKLLKPPRA